MKYRIRNWITITAESTVCVAALWGCAIIITAVS